jgi:hypothetical protein
MKIKSILTGADLIASVITVLFIYFIINKDFLNSISNELANTGITVFSIIFPLFFAAFSIIMSSSDDEFAKYLHSKNYYNHIIDTFKFTLWLNFISLLFSILLKFYTISFQITELMNNRLLYIIILLYIFICLYALFATFNAIMDSIKYTKYRGLFLNRKK